MKKITFILFALITGTGFAQTNVSSSAEIIEAITVTETAGLNFGKVDNSAGTVIISTSGVDTGTKTQITGGAAISAAALTISGAPSETYSITVPTSTTLGGPGTLNVTGISHNSTEKLDSSGDETVNIGGTLTLVGGEATGAYAGTISVTVSYN